MRFEHKEKHAKTIDIVDWDYIIYIKFSVDFFAKLFGIISTGRFDNPHRKYTNWNIQHR